MLLHLQRQSAILVLPFVFLAFAANIAWGQKSEIESVDVTFESLEKDLTIRGQLYAVADKDKSRPFIILCHQAGWSRGEYQEIAPKLNEMGFNCLAIDQRSGGEVNGVKNETAALAKKRGMDTGFVAAEKDILAIVQRVREADHAKGKVILWGSSYSAALVLRIAGEHPDLVDGVLSFAPGEYFRRFDKPADWIQNSAGNITVPVFITSAKNEFRNWSAIFDAIPGDAKTSFVPETAGNHGSRALWERFDDHDAYWEVTRAFLKQFVETDDQP